MGLRMSASDLDAWRYWRGQEDAELAPLLAQLRKQSAPSEAMLAGTALHSALEVIEPGEFDVLEADGFEFRFAEGLAVELPAVRELKATRDYVIDGIVVTLVGKVDCVDGLRIDDHKFTGQYDAERFLASYQWRVYLEVFGADVMRWNVFEGSEREPRSYMIRALHRLECYRYPGIGADLEGQLRGFVAFAREYLPERFTA